MVQEYRKIMLSTEEALMAFDAYRRMRPEFLPLGKITDCKGSGGAVVMSLEVSGDGGAVQKKDVTLQLDDLLKPMVRFCIENNIMLPRAGKKTVEIVGGQVSLCIDFKWGIETVNLVPISDVNPTDVFSAVKGK